MGEALQRLLETSRTCRNLVKRRSALLEMMCTQLGRIFGGLRGANGTGDRRGGGGAKRMRSPKTGGLPKHPTGFGLRELGCGRASMPPTLGAGCGGHKRIQPTGVHPKLSSAEPQASRCLGIPSSGIGPGLFCRPLASILRSPGSGPLHAPNRNHPKPGQGATLNAAEPSAPKFGGTRPDGSASV